MFERLIFGEEKTNPA